MAPKGRATKRKPASAEDAEIVRMANECKALKHRIYFCFNHEPEDDTNLCGTAADFVAAAAKVAARVPEARFVFIGDGPQRRALEAKAFALGLERWQRPPA